MGHKKTGHKRSNVPTYNLTCKNGISFKTDVGLSTADGLKPGIYPLLQLIVTAAASLSTVYMLIGFFNVTDTLSNDLRFSYELPVFFTVLLTAFSVLLLNSKPNAAKAMGTLYLIGNTIFLLTKLEDTVNGAMGIIYKYTANAKLSEPLFWEIAEDITTSETNMFLLTFSFIITMLIALACFYRSNFPLLFICTFPVFELGTFWGWETYTWTIAVMLASWIITLSLNMINHTAKRKGGNSIFAIYRRRKAFYLIGDNIKRRFFSTASAFILKSTAVILALCILTAVLSDNYRPDSFDKLRYDISTGFDDFISRLGEGVSDSGSSVDNGIPGRGKAVGGTNGGQLGLYNKISFSGSIALKVTSEMLADTDNGCSTYLRGYTGEEYSYGANNWEVLEVADSVKTIFDNYSFTPLDYGYIQYTDGDVYGAHDSISVKAVSANKDLIYAPYFSLYSTSDNFDCETYSGIAETKERSETTVLSYSSPTGSSNDDVTDILQEMSGYYTSGDMITDYYGYMTYSYLVEANFPALADYTYYLDQISDYTYVPTELYDVLDSIIDGSKAKNYYYISDIKNALKDYMKSMGFEYTLEPGITPEGEDFIEYFLTEQKEGYCTYFASAGVMLMRRLGYQARYVEGYVISPEQYGADTINVTDRCAHAWCEVYLPYVGWIPLEFTPGYTGENPNLTDKEITSDSSADDTVQSTAQSEAQSAAQADSSSAADNTSSAANGGNTSSAAANNNSSSADSDNSSANGGNNTSTNNSSDGGGGNGTDGSGDSGGGSGGKTLDKTTVGYVSVSVLFIAVVAAVIIIRRKLSLSRLEARLNDPVGSKAVIACYEAYLRYIALVGIKTEDNITDMQMASQIAEQLKEKFPQLCKPFEQLSECAIAAYMGGKAMTDEDAETARQTVYEARTLIYEKLNFIEKLIGVWGENLY